MAYRGQPATKYWIEGSLGSKSTGRLILWIGKSSGLPVYHEFEALDKEHTMVVSRAKLNEMIRTERRLRWFNKVAKPKLMFAGCGILVGTVIVAMVRWLG